MGFFSDVWDFFLAILNWAWDGIIANLLMWLTLSTLNLVVVVIGALILRWIVEQLEDAKSGKSGTPGIILFMIPLVSIITLPFFILSSLLVIFLTWNMLVLLWPFSAWGDKDAWTHMDITEQYYGFIFGKETSMDLLYSVNSPISYILFLISIIFCFSFRRHAAQEDKDRFGTLMAGLVCLTALFPMLQLFFWNPASIPVEEIEWTKDFHVLAIILSAVVVSATVAKAIENSIIYFAGGSIAERDPGVEIVPYSVDSGEKIVLYFMGLVIYILTYFSVFAMRDPMDGSGILGLNASMIAFSSILTLRIGIIVISILILGLLAKRLHVQIRERGSEING